MSPRLPLDPVRGIPIESPGSLSPFQDVPESRRAAGCSIAVVIGHLSVHFGPWPPPIRHRRAPNSNIRQRAGVRNVPASYTATIHITGPTTPFHDSVAARYNYAFGKDSPFLPSNAMSVNGQFLSPKASTPPNTAATATRRPTTSGASPFTPIASAPPGTQRTSTCSSTEKGVQFSRHCEGCHNPVALLSGDLSQGMPKKRPFEEEGVTCSTCHSIQSTDATGTGSYVMGIPAVLVDENGAAITRPVSDAEILAHLDRHSKAVMRPLYKTAEFCAACHKAAIPASLDDYKWLRAISLYDEWQGASFTKQSPLPFYRKDSVSTCQTCHMPREALTGGADDPGAKDGKLASHRWLGGNTLMPQYYNYHEQAEKLVAVPEERLRRQRRLQRRHLRPRERQPGQRTPQRQSSPPAPSSSPRSASRPFTSPRAKPSPPTSSSRTRASPTPSSPSSATSTSPGSTSRSRTPPAKTLAESGFIQPDGDLDPSAHSFTNRLVNIKGELNDLHQIWHNRVLAYNNTIQSGRSQLVRYRFRVPKDAQGPAHHHRHRQLPPLQPALHRLRDGPDPSSKHYPMPIVDMASQTRTLDHRRQRPRRARPRRKHGLDALE